MVRPGARPRSVAGTALAMLALAALVVATGSIPHTHAGRTTGLYNQEHDLAAFAAVGAAAAIPDSGAVAPLVVVARATALPTLAPPAAPRSLDRSRAPPLR